LLERRAHDNRTGQRHDGRFRRAGVVAAAHIVVTRLAEKGSPQLGVRTPKVSVVVPVYNPGRFIDPCIDSLLSQSLPADDVELVFVDDGSTDDTPARLDSLAAAHGNVHVIHTRNSGWPGRPRNIGIEAARGEYVQFVDNDDSLTPEALERLYAIGHRNRADVVIGKVASDFRGVPQSLFRRSREACTIHDAPLIDSLTPHKMFRRAFLRDNDLRFPEGKRRLEDQLFVVRAYFAARVVSVLADYVCYRYMRRPDRRNAGSEWFDPPQYFANLAEILDVVVANTEPGEFRERLLRRFLRVEMLNRLSEPKYPRHSAAFREKLYVAIRDLMRESIEERVDAGLGPIHRLRAQLVRRDDADPVLELARRLAAVDGRARVESLAWRRGRLECTVSASFVRDAAGTELHVVRDGERRYLDPSLKEGITTEPLDIGDEGAGLDAQVYARHPSTGAEWVAPTRGTMTTRELRGPTTVEHPGVRAIASIDPLQLITDDVGRTTTWDIRVRVSGLGIDRRVPATVDADHSAFSASGPALVGDRPRVIVPVANEDGTLGVAVDSMTVGAALRSATTRFEPTDGRTIVAHLGLPLIPDTRPIPAALVLDTGGSVVSWPAGLEAGPDDAVVVAAARDRPRLRAGRYRLSLTIGGAEAESVEIGAVSVEADGRIFPDGTRRIGRVAGAAKHARHAVSDVLGVDRRRAALEAIARQPIRVALRRAEHGLARAVRVLPSDVVERFRFLAPGRRHCGAGGSLRRRHQR